MGLRTLVSNISPTILWISTKRYPPRRLLDRWMTSCFNLVLHHVHFPSFSFSSGKHINSIQDTFFDGGNFLWSATFLTNVELTLKPCPLFLVIGARLWLDLATKMLLFRLFSHTLLCRCTILHMTEYNFWFQFLWCVSGVVDQRVHWSIVIWMQDCIIYL